jgi:hypothetical protein
MKWVFHEPPENLEDANMKAPLGFRFSPWSLFPLPFLNCLFATKNSKLKWGNDRDRKKSMRVLFAILVILAWVLGSAIQAEAETMNYKLYTYVTKQELVPVGDVEGHTVGFTLRSSLLVFEDGEVATVNAVITNDAIGGSGSFMQYVTMKFSDDSTIIVKSQGTFGTPVGGSYTAAGRQSEIIKGIGRFEGIKRTVTSKAKYLPVEKGEPGPKGIGEGTLTFTLPSK